MKLQINMEELQFMKKFKNLFNKIINKYIEHSLIILCEL